MTLGRPEIQIEAASGTDVEDALRCLTTLYASCEGEQALDRRFGISIEPLDKPLSAAKALLTAELVSKTARYEPRMQVKRVEWDESELAQGVLRPKVVIQYVGNRTVG